VLRRRITNSSSGLRGAANRPTRAVKRLVYLPPAQHHFHMSPARAYGLGRSAALAFGLVLAAALTLQGQDSKKREPKRPKLDAGRDTNSAGAYHQHGMLHLAKRPQVAADAFYWAARLDPSIAEPCTAVGARCCSRCNAGTCSR